MFEAGIEPPTYSLQRYRSTIALALHIVTVDKRLIYILNLIQFSWTFLFCLTKHTYIDII